MCKKQVNRSYFIPPHTFKGVPSSDAVRSLYAEMFPQLPIPAGLAGFANLLCPSANGANAHLNTIVLAVVDPFEYTIKDAVPVDIPWEEMFGHFFIEDNDSYVNVRMGTHQRMLLDKAACHNKVQMQLGRQFQRDHHVPIFSGYLELYGHELLHLLSCKQETVTKCMGVKLMSHVTKYAMGMTHDHSGSYRGFQLWDKPKRLTEEV